MTDAQLLGRFVDSSDQQAFAELVGRHVHWVNSMARRMVRDDSLAADATQAAFILLSRKASSLRHKPVIATWLFNVTHYASLKVIRTEARRRKHERIAAAMRAQTAPITDPSQWDDLAPMLDDMVRRLRTSDREAILLRFYEQKSFPEIGQALEISEEAARKRVSRAVEQLRASFARKGVTVGAATLATAMTSQLTQPASAAVVAASIAVTPLAASATGSAAALAKGVMAMMTWTKINLTAAIALSLLFVTCASVVLSQLQVAQQQATSPATAPATQPTDTTTLIREARQSLAWLEQAKSFHIKLEGETTSIVTEQAPQIVQATAPSLPSTNRNSNAANLQRIGQALLQYSQQNAPIRQPGVHKISGSLEVAFDGKRLYRMRQYDPNDPDGYTDLRFFDGTRSLAYFHSRAEHGYYLGDTPDRAAATDLWLSELHFELAGVRFWWSSKTRPPVDMIGSADGWTLAGKEMFRGTECYALDRIINTMTRLYVGVEDHHLYGLSYRLPNPLKLEETEIALAKELGRQISNTREFDAWVRSLPPTRRATLQSELNKRMYPISVPYWTKWMADYKEIASGCWVPMTQGMEQWKRDNSSPPEVSSWTNWSITDVAVDQPLPDSLFRNTMKDGVFVQDTSGGALLEYIQKADRSQTEWVEIRADGERRRKMWQVQPQLSPRQVVGQPAPEFPASVMWVNGTPQKLSDLRGKCVILVFWASWRGYGDNSTTPDRFGPVLSMLDPIKKDVVVIGIHVPTQDVAKVSDALKQRNLPFPTCIDVPLPGQGFAWGTLSDQYRVGTLPQYYVIDQQGRIAWEGNWGTVVEKAKQILGAAPVVPLETPYMRAP